MLFRLLGPLDVRTDDGRVLRPRGDKQRLLLATLVLDAPRVSSADRLIDVIWRDHAPANSAAALRSQISRLRAFLGERGPGERFLRSAPHGYRLAVDREHTDAGRFEILQMRARELTDAERALALLDDALALWQGDPFEELPGRSEFLAEVTRLHALRTDACERRIECLLALGKAHEALGSVQALIHDGPLRERPRALCMEALSRAGRQHEALSVFQDYRHLLSEELGLDPSPALQQLESEILRHGSARDRSSVTPRVAARADGGREAPAPDALDPPARAGMGAITHLPAPITPLIGRSQTMASVLRLLQANRLLTLTGSGGSGKTRLALEVAHRMQDERMRDVAWVTLESITDPASVAQEVAAAINARDHPQRLTTDLLRQILSPRRALLVLDNCEHLVDACAELVATLLRSCPELVVLATSREPLGIPGETTWPVPPLSLPEEDGTDPEAAAGAAAVELFVTRARGALPTFVLTDANAAAVARICRQLDGIPLALELAAARVRVLSPAEITRRLESDFDLLSGASRSVMPRHQTLRAAIDWSYWLLSEPERVMLERLSVFSGGFDLDAAEAVCADRAVLPSDRILELLSALVDKSLVVTQRERGRTRYRLIETVRSNASARLAARGSAAEFRRRHAEHFCTLAEQAEPYLFGGAGDPAWVARVDRDDRNVRAAVDWCLAEETRVETALRLLPSLHWYWFARGRFREGRQHLVAALQHAERAPKELRARALTALGIVQVWQGDAAAALAPLTESVGIVRGLEDARALAYALTCLGAATLGSDPAASHAICDEAAAQVRTQPPSVLTAFVRFWHGLSALSLGNDVTALHAFEEAVAVGRALRNKPCIAHPLTILGRLEAARGHQAKALAAFAESLAIHREVGDLFGTILVIEGVAGVAATTERPERAVRLFGAAEALRDTIGGPLLPFEESRYRATIVDLARRLNGDTCTSAWTEGKSLSVEQAIDGASLCIRELAEAATAAIPLRGESPLTSR